MRLLPKQSCTLWKPSASTLCFESSLFSFSPHEWNSDPHKSRGNFLLVSLRFVFLIKPGQPVFLMENSVTSFLCNQKRARVDGATELCISPISCRILQNPEPIFFTTCITTIQKTAYQVTQPVQHFNMNCNNAVHRYSICQEFPTIQPALLCYIKIEAQKKYECKVHELCSSNVSNLCSSNRSLTEHGYYYSIKTSFE